MKTELKITGTTFRVLDALDEIPQTMSMVSKKTNIEYYELRGILQALKDLGLAQRITPHGRYWSLTKKGLKLFEEQEEEATP
jgi:predicted transcriptional regulator